MAGRDSFESRAAAAMAPGSSSTMKPVTPSSITSGIAPALKAITGQPQAIASIRTRPNGSGQSAGANRHAAPLRNSDFWWSPISPMCSTAGGRSNGRISDSK